MDKYRLCYVDRVEEWKKIYQLYFTDNFETQWGDDWNDAPADCNAERPYEDDEHHIVSMIIEFNRDVIDHLEDYSIEDINKGIVPYITFSSPSQRYFICGGDTILDVMTKLEISGEADIYYDKNIMELIFNANKVES